MTSVSIWRLVQLACLACLGSCIAAARATAQGDTLYDIVIRHGRVLDGEGNPWIAADVAIKDGKFARIGKITAHGAKEIDATGKYVSPGWIDMMDQSGSVLPRSGSAENKLQEGVTTALGGEGGTPVPAGRIAEYFANLEKQGISINFGSYFSETQARVAKTDAHGARPHARDHGHCHAKWSAGDVDGAHLSAIELQHDRRAGGDRQGGRKVRRYLRESHAR
jgi:hypothetical protein